MSHIFLIDLLLESIIMPDDKILQIVRRKLRDMFIKSRDTLPKLEMEILKKRGLLKYVKNEKQPESTVSEIIIGRGRLDFRKRTKEEDIQYRINQAKRDARQVLDKKFEKEFVDLNKILRPHRIKFSDLSAVRHAGEYHWDTGNIVISTKELYNVFVRGISYNEDEEVEEVINSTITTVGHELIHRKQMANAGYANAGGSNKCPQYNDNITAQRYAAKKPDTMANWRYNAHRHRSRYHNRSPEIAAWAYDVIHDAILNKKITDMNSAIKFIRRFARYTSSTNKMINYYTPENKKRLLRLMVDYAKELLAKQ